MKTTDFNFKTTAAQLNETMFKKFGTKLNFEKYSREDLENYRNLLRTKIHQAESSTNFNDLLTNEAYQKDKYVMTVINTKIKEMLGEGAKVDRQAKHITKSMMKSHPDMSKDDAEGAAWAHIKHPKKKKKAEEGVEETTMNRLTTEAKAKLAAKDYDGDGKKETPKDEVWGSRAKAAAKAGKPFKEAMSKKCCCSTKGENECPVHGQMDEGWDDMMKSVKDRSEEEKKSKGTGKFDKKKTTTGTQYTRKSNTFTDGGDDSDTKAAKKKAKAASESMPVKKKKIKESTLIFRRHVAIVNESLLQLLREDEEGKAKAITAASDMVNDFTTWMQRVGQYQTKSMIELADAIRADFGQEESDAFKSAVGPALAATLEVMTQQREAISHAVAVLAGEATDMGQMGGDDLSGMEPGADEFGGEMPAGDEMNTDEFGASDAAAGGSETSGRELRESRFSKRLSESHSIMRALSR